MTTSPLRIVIDHHPTTRPITEAGLGSDELDMAFTHFDPIHKAFKPMLRRQEYDVSEVAIVAAIQAVAYGCPVIVLPVTVAARFQHKCVVYNGNRGEIEPRDLIGKRIGVRSYTQTTGAWVRAILAREHGVPSGDVTWVTVEEPHVEQYRDPDNVEKVPSSPGLLEMLENGEIDAAIFGNDLPGQDWVRPVISDPEIAARRSFAEDGVIPINHLVVASRDFAEQRPLELQTLYGLFVRSKAVAYADNPPQIDLRPIGFEAMRRPVSILLEEALDQKLLPQAMSFDDLFAPAMELLGAGR